MALNPNVVVVATGELITATHLNNIRSNLVGLDNLKANDAAVVHNSGPGRVDSTFTVGPATDALTSAGSAIFADGRRYAYSDSNVGLISPSIMLTRGGTAGGAGGYFMLFRRLALDTGAGVNSGSIVVNSGGNGVTYNTSSDYRLKDEIGPIVDPLGVVGALQPKRLRWKSTKVRFDGFLAHEVQQVIPSAVTGDKDAVYPADDELNEPGGINPQQLDATAIIPVLVAAVQELTARVAELEAAAA